ncbi:MAG: hypothetical protein HZC54_08005 [Verrucomicrobia bacterium]|nr:hypothetical protein [Verrucomicrobiota bacterium]
MKTIPLTLLLVIACVAAFADDAKAPAAPRKNKVTFEYSYPPAPTQKPSAPAEAAPLPRVGSKSWLQRLDQRDRKAMAPWEWRRLNAWREAYSFAEPPPSVNDFTSTWR